jgi:phenylalanyl-tRNA synthetase beta subunit
VVHPEIKAAIGARQDFVFAEFDVDALIELEQKGRYREPSEFPAVRRDVTLKIPPRSLAGRVSRTVRDMDQIALVKDALREVSIVDHFQKPDEKFRRVTYRVTFQSAERTLESAEVDKAMEAILAGLKDKHGLELA